MLMWAYPTDSIITDRWKLCETQGLNDFGHPGHLQANPKHYKIVEECSQILNIRQTTYKYFIASGKIHCIAIVLI